MKSFIAKIIFIFLISNHLFALTRINFDQQKTQKVKAISSDKFSSHSYSFGLGLSRPDFKNGVKHLEKMYGKSSYSPVFKFIYYYDLGSLSLGSAFSVSWYTDRGKVIKKDGGNIPNDDAISTGEQSIALTLVPYSFTFNVKLHPFSKDFFVIDTWFGYEELYWEESRNIDTNDSDQESKVYLSKAWNSFWVWGASVKFRIDTLDEKSSKSMKRSLGISKVSLVPYFEQSINRSSSKLIFNRKVSKMNFSRNTVGLAFYFDTL